MKHLMLRSFICATILAAAAIAAVTLLAYAPQTHAAVDAFEFDTPEQQERFRRLSNDFRCPMCQNTNLTGSGGGVAEDLRREVYLMVMDGKTDYEIEQFMFERYGDFIFYKPRLMANTLLLWFGPLLFLLIGGFVVYRIIKRAQPDAQGISQQLDNTEQERLRRLLDK